MLNKVFSFSSIVFWLDLAVMIDDDQEIIVVVDNDDDYERLGFFCRKKGDRATK